MASGKLSNGMMTVLDAAVFEPITDTNNKSVKALIKRGMLVEVHGRRSFYTPSSLALKLMGISQEYVDLQYAKYWLADGIQIRHNCKIVWSNFGNYELRSQWYQRSFNDEVNAVSDWLDRAIELTRAEIRAGIAS